MARKPDVLLSGPAGVWGELSMAEGDGGQRPAAELVSEAATKASLNACGYISAHMGILEHRGRQTVGLEIPTQEFLLLSPRMRPSLHLPFLFTTPSCHLGSGDKGKPAQREVGIPHDGLGEVAEEREEGNRMHGEKWFACCSSPHSFSPGDFVALNCLKTGSGLEQSFELPFLLTTWWHSPAPQLRAQ